MKTGWLILALGARLTAGAMTRQGRKIVKTVSDKKVLQLKWCETSVFGAFWLFMSNDLLVKLDDFRAFWGAPVDDGEQALHAVEAALDMTDALMAFKADLGKQDENFDVGIGIHTGPGVVGFIGSHNRLDYTAIGDTVNLASRIEGQTKGVARILVSNETRKQCGEKFEFIDHGIFKVKGRTEEVQLFEPRRISL